MHDGTLDTCPDSATHLPAPAGHCEPPFLAISRRTSVKHVQSSCHAPPLAPAWSKVHVFVLPRERSAGIVTKGDVLVRDDTDSLYELAPGSDAPERVRTLASPVVGWPGARVAARALAKDEELSGLEDRVASLVDLRLDGEPAKSSVHLRYAETAREAWGAALVFVVDVAASSSQKGPFYRWTADVHMTGALVMRASDGAFAALRVSGPVDVSEALWRDPVEGLGLRHDPTPCHRGEMSVEVEWDCGQCLWRDGGNRHDVEDHSG